MGTVFESAGIPPFVQPDSFLDLRRLGRIEDFYVGRSLTPAT
jgi:hypothetical protein